MVFARSAATFRKGYIAFGVKDLVRGSVKIGLGEVGS